MQRQARTPPPGSDASAVRVEEITRITLRPLGSPMPLGFFVVAVSSALVAASQVGIIGRDGTVALGLGLAPAFALQLVVAVFALLARDAVAATVMGMFASSWLVSVLLLILAPPHANQTLGVYFSFYAVFLVLMAWIARPKFVLCVLLSVAVPRFALSAIFEATGSSGVEHAAGAAGFALALVSLYAAYALLLEDARGYTVLPEGRRGSAETAIDGDVGDQLAGLEHQAGIRHTL